MRDDLKTNPISWYVFTVNTAACGGAGAARKLNSLWADDKGSEVEFLLSCVGEGHSAIQAMFSKAVIKARQLRSRAGALISQQAPNFTSITPSPSRLCYVFLSLYWFNPPPPQCFNPSFFWLAVNLIFSLSGTQVISYELICHIQVMLIRMQIDIFVKKILT